MKYDALIQSYLAVLPRVTDPDAYSTVVHEIQRLRDLQAASA